MSDIFISYARSTAAQTQAIAEALRGAGYGVWLDDELPAHRSYSEVIEERLKAAKAVVVIWSAEAVKSQWVQSEADRAREQGKLVQLTIDGARPPMPFDRIQCADLAGWGGDTTAPGWRKALASVEALIGAAAIDTPPPPLPAKPSIVVLPFTRLSADADQDYFADGMVEEIVAALSRFRSIFVIGSGSGLSFKGAHVSPQLAARQLGVRYVLEGSVRKAAGRVRIAVKLTDADQDAVIWADRFEDTLEDIFALQDRVALSVASIIEPTIMSAEVRRASSRPTPDLGSYDLYLRTLPLMSRFARGEIFEAIDLLEKAIALDPDYALATGAAALAYSQVFVVAGWSENPAEHRRRGLELAHRALRLAGDDPDVLNFVATAMWHLGEKLGDAIVMVDRSLALNSGSAVGWQTSGWLRIAAGEVEVGIGHLQTSLRLDPVSHLRPIRLTGIGVGRCVQRRFEEAVALFRESAQLLSGYPSNHAMLAYCYGKLGKRGSGLAAIESLESSTSGSIEDWAIVAVAPSARADFLATIADLRGKPAAAPV
ncbi:MAG TPA: TIR domain-containing protein [Caulobacteraceae bacterium]